MTRSLFETLELAPRDPILGLTEAYVADPRPNKINLGVGVYYDENGKVPLLKAVLEAERERLANPSARSYLPIEGIHQYNGAVQALLLGADSDTIQQGRAITVQALGGTGALKLGADFVRRLEPQASCYISDPSWENHRALFEAAGFNVNNYTYYDAAINGLNFAGMLASLKTAPRRSLIVLHACCHNPTGVDLSDSQWADVVKLVTERELIPFLDIAYQGFGDGLDADAAAVRQFAASGLTFLISSSFSKSVSLYGERVGALTMVTGSRDESSRVLSQIKRVIRTNYSNPPTHGASVVSAILNKPHLRAMWEEELAGMRERIRSMRTGLVERLNAANTGRDFSFIVRQRGMFSYSGLNAQQVDRLREEFAIYAVGTGRICVAALNNGNLDAVSKAIVAVL